MKTLSDNWNDVIKAYKVMIFEILEIFCNVKIYCMSMLSLHVVCTNSMLERQQVVINGEALGGEWGGCP